MTLKFGKDASISAEITYFHGSLSLFLLSKQTKKIVQVTD